MLPRKIAQFRCDEHLGFKLAQRAHGNAYELAEFLPGRPRRPLRKVTRYGYRSTTHLRSKAIHFLPWKLLRNQVNSLNKSHRLPPRVQTFVWSRHSYPRNHVACTAGRYGINVSRADRFTCRRLGGRFKCVSRFTFHVSRCGGLLQPNKRDSRFTVHVSRCGI